MIESIRKVSAVDEVFQAIYSRILSGEFPEGHLFPSQISMAESFGVSRPTIREAVNRLKQLGLVTSKPKVGTLVTNHSQSSYVNSLEQYRFLTSDELAHFIEARLYLEKSALRLAIMRLQKDDVIRLNALLAEQGEAMYSDDPELFPRLDRQFHRTIIEISQNKVLLQFLGMIWNAVTQMTDIRNTQNRHTSFQYHGAIVKHLADRNLARAEKAITEHLHDLTENIERNIGHYTGLDKIFKLEKASLANLPPISPK